MHTWMFYNILFVIWDQFLKLTAVFINMLQVATRLAYGTALVKLGKSNNRVIALDGDVKNSTFSIKFKVLILAGLLA